MQFQPLVHLLLLSRMTAKQAFGLLMNHLQFEAAVTKFVKFDRNFNEVFKKLEKMKGRSMGSGRQPMRNSTRTRAR